MGVGKLLVINLVLAAGLACLAGCSEHDSDWRAVDVNADPGSVEKGKTLACTAEVVGKTRPPQGVTWSIVEAAKDESTTISAAGLLTVALAETQGKLTVKAVSTFDTTLSGSASVQILDPLTYLDSEDYNISGTTGTPITPKEVYRSVSGGKPPYAFTAQNLPAGLSISGGGIISGTPTASGSATVVITVTDSRGVSTYITIDCTIN